MSFVFSSSELWGIKVRKGEEEEGDEAERVERSSVHFSKLRRIGTDGGGLIIPPPPPFETYLRYRYRFIWGTAELKSQVYLV